MQLAGSILIDGLAYAMILFMITVGLSVTLGLMHVVNMAHGAFAMSGGYLTALAMDRWGLRFEYAALFAILATVALSYPIERVLISRLYRRRELDQALVTIGIAFIAIALINSIAGSSVTVFELPSYLAGPVDLGFRSVPRHRIAVIVLGFAVCLILWLALDRSTLGIKLKASVDSSATAEAVGINTKALYAGSFVLGAGLAAIGGIAGAELLPMESTYAVKYLALFLAVVAVGGQGSVAGSLFAALLLGMVDTATKYLVPSLSSLSFYLTMFVVLALWPKGLLGKAGSK